MTEINNYIELQHYIKIELSKQITDKKKTAEIKLNKLWFYNLAKFICFYLKYDKEEKDAKRGIKETDTYYKVIINGVKTKIILYDIQGKEDL